MLTTLHTGVCYMAAWFTQRAELTYTQPCTQPLFVMSCYTKKALGETLLSCFFWNHIKYNLYSGVGFLCKAIKGNLNIGMSS